MEAAGCSKSYASSIRAGKFTPHVSNVGEVGDPCIHQVIHPNLSARRLVLPATTRTARMVSVDQES